MSWVERFRASHRIAVCPPRPLRYLAIYGFIGDVQPVTRQVAQFGSGIGPEEIPPRSGVIAHIGPRAQIVHGFAQDIQGAVAS